MPTCTIRNDELAPALASLDALATRRDLDFAAVVYPVTVTRRSARAAHLAYQEDLRDLAAQFGQKDGEGKLKATRVDGGGVRVDLTPEGQERKLQLDAAPRSFEYEPIDRAQLHGLSADELEPLLPLLSASGVTASGTTAEAAAVSD